MLNARLSEFIRYVPWNSKLFTWPLSQYILAIPWIAFLNEMICCDVGIVSGNGDKYWFACWFEQEVI